MNEIFDGRHMPPQKETARPRGTDSAKVIQVIVTESIRGRGTDEDPVRDVLQYWDFDGNLLAEFDPILSGTQEVKEG